MGAAYKRMVLVDTAAGRQARVRQGLRQMEAAYKRAQQLGEESGAGDLYYPISNRLTAEVALRAGSSAAYTLPRATTKLLRDSLKAQSATDPNFWSVVGETELDQYEALAARTLAPASTKLAKAYEDLHRRVTAARMWGSVYDTACMVLPTYARRATGRERAAANDLLTLLRSYAHPDASA